MTDWLSYLTCPSWSLECQATFKPCQLAIVFDCSFMIFWFLVLKHCVLVKFSCLFFLVWINVHRFVLYITQDKMSSYITPIPPYWCCGAVFVTCIIMYTIFCIIHSCYIVIFKSLKIRSFKERQRAAKVQIKINGHVPVGSMTLFCTISLNNASGFFIFCLFFFTEPKPDPFANNPASGFWCSS